MFRSKNKLVILVIAFVMTITGVFGAWTYAEGVIDPVNTIVDVSLFEWLPGMGTDDDDGVVTILTVQAQTTMISSLLLFQMLLIHQRLQTLTQIRLL